MSELVYSNIAKSWLIVVGLAVTGRPEPSRRKRVAEADIRSAALTHGI